MNKANSVQPLSATSYVIIALLGLTFAAGFTLFYVYRVPILVQSGVQGQVFYLLLIPWALSCAAFLFGAMKSYAKFTYRRLGMFLELGGPVVLFCLVVVGGFKLVPPAPETFDLTVRAHSADSLDPMISMGKVTLDFDTDRRTESFGPNGEANFKGVAARFRGATLKVLPQVDGYEEQWQQPGQQQPGQHGNVLDLTLVREQPHALLTGSVLPPPQKGRDVQVLVDGQKTKSTVDEFGRFELAVDARNGDRVRVKVYADGQLAYDDYEVIPGPITLHPHFPY